MAGFKNSVMSLSPVCFLTFDGDSFDNTTKQYTGSMPATLLDESGNSNNALLLTENPTFSNYRLGQVSLNDVEVSTQYSLALG